MGQIFTKIKYATEGPYGTDVWENLYLHWSTVSDIYTLFDNNMKPIIHFSDWGGSKEGFAARLDELLSYMPDDSGEHPNNVEYCTAEEIKALEENMFK